MARSGSLAQWEQRLAAQRREDDRRARERRQQERDAERVRQQEHLASRQQEAEEKTAEAQARMKAPARLASNVAARRGLPMTRMSERTSSASILSIASAAAISHSTRLAVVASILAR